MAVVAVKSAFITNRDSTPVVLTSKTLSAGGPRLRAAGLVAVASGDSATSTYRFCQVPANALVSSVLLSAPDIGTTTTMDIGLYRTTADGGAVVDADFFTAACNLNSGATTKVERLNGNIITIANSEKRLWEAAGLSADPGYFYDIVGTLVGAADAAGSVLCEVIYDV